MPTWNYQTVHVYGKPELITEAEELKSIVNEFTEMHESSFETPWEPEYKDSLSLSISLPTNIEHIIPAMPKYLRYRILLFISNDQAQMTQEDIR